MPSNYPFNVDQNYVPNLSTPEDISKVNRIPGLNANDQQQHTSVSFKEERSKDDVSLNESSKPTHLHVYIFCAIFNNYVSYLLLYI